MASNGGGRTGSGQRMAPPWFEKQESEKSTVYFSRATSAAARLPSLNMPPKCPATTPAMSLSVAKTTRKSLTLKVKLDSIHRHETREN
ncbi:hypothetical protein E2C01_003505 [Portunus trituberculatus]|uniref:Uncharacterized protein n=1 Tax=Portunus trituberculatus TaxID=210409 RepID=A0A5B7CPY8_PORTR|nr:hypothetical protein [Portunus trituberculatus]